MIVNIETISDILDILKNEPDFDNWQIYGDVSTKTEGDYILFNYTAEAQYNNRWNNFELMSRGLIIDRKQLKIVARPFDKFFNWNENGRNTDAPIEYVMPKMDGSLGVCWYDENFGWRITTRGSFNSEQAIWATNHLNENYCSDLGDLIKGWTYLFEIIYPENRIVVDYGDIEDLYLLACRDNYTGLYAEEMEVFRTAWRLDCPCYIGTHSPHLENIYKTLESMKGIENEGFVTVHADGSRWKFKSEDYVRIHRIISTLSFKNVLQAYANEDTFEYLENIPDEFLKQVKEWIFEIMLEEANLENAVENAWNLTADIRGNRKEFALWINEHAKHLAPYLFRKLDGKEYRSLIFKKHDFSHLESKSE